MIREMRQPSDSRHHPDYAEEEKKNNGKIIARDNVDKRAIDHHFDSIEEKVKNEFAVGLQESVREKKSRGQSSCYHRPRRTV